MNKDIDVSDILLFTIIIAAFALFVLGIITNSVEDIRAIEAGLQQCVVENKTVWQKECGK